MQYIGTVNTVPVVETTDLNTVRERTLSEAEIEAAGKKWAVTAWIFTVREDGGRSKREHWTVMPNGETIGQVRTRQRAPHRRKDR